MCLSRHKTVDDLRQLATALEKAAHVPGNTELTRIGHLVKRCFLHLAHVTHSDYVPASRLSLATEFIDWDALWHSLMYSDAPEAEVDDALYDPVTGKHFLKEPKPERP